MDITKIEPHTDLEGGEKVAVLLSKFKTVKKCDFTDRHPPCKGQLKDL